MFPIPWVDKKKIFLYHEQIKIILLVVPGVKKVLMKKVETALTSNLQGIFQNFFELRDPLHQMFNLTLKSLHTATIYIFSRVPDYFEK